MKVTFVYPDEMTHRVDWTGYFNIGLGSLSAVLKKEHHETSLIHITRPINRSHFIKRIKQEDPDLIGFSITSHMFSTVKKLASWLWEAPIRIPTIGGGIHPTIAPEETIGTEGIDMICRGEGETSLVELCRKMENSEDISHIPNLWLKEDGTINRNALGPLLDNLDSLPFPDRTIFSYSNLYQERQGLGMFMASRGCPYSCTYCCNYLLREIYGKLNIPVRFRTVDKVIEEIDQVVKQYPFIRGVVFDDDILFLNRMWAEEFSEKYSRKIGLPFVCNARADIIDQEMVARLKEAGCFLVKFGLESGNEEIRYRVLNRPMTNGQIERAFTSCRKAGILTESFNMVGIPFETPKAILDTIKLNASIGVNKMQVTIYQPYPGTQLSNLCFDHHFVESRDLELDFFSSSILRLDTVSALQVMMFRDYFKLLVRCYQGLAMLSDRVSKVSMQLSDRILSSPQTARILNFIHIPLNYLFRRINLLRFSMKKAQRDIIGLLNHRFRNGCRKKCRTT